ncbi:MAG: type I methionyl aminopeptidase [Candidatus Omnitrophica bacterium]|nr:type I methionyl aminopeptidase [Candidatus Omnitrophota bacterium]
MASISIKTKEDLKILQEAAKILRGIIDRLKCSLKSGMRTQDVDGLAGMIMKQFKVKSAFKGYRGYPANVCVSINDEVVHGIPGSRLIKEGDLVSIDAGIIHKGFYADMAVTVGIGTIDQDLKKMLLVAEGALIKGIGQTQVGHYLSDISHAIQTYVESNGFSVVREFVGHGIGRELHEDPEIPNYGIPKRGPILQEGMVFCIEPMVNQGDWKTRICDDGWTVVTMDGKPSAHFEHMVAITKNGPLILTQ